MNYTSSGGRRRAGFGDKNRTISQTFYCHIIWKSALYKGRGSHAGMSTPTKIGREETTRCQILSSFATSEEEELQTPVPCNYLWLFWMCQRVWRGGKKQRRGWRSNRIIHWLIHAEFESIERPGGVDLVFLHTLCWYFAGDPREQTKIKSRVDSWGVAGRNSVGSIDRNRGSSLPETDCTYQVYIVEDIVEEISAKSAIEQDIEVLEGVIPSWQLENDERVDPTGCKHSSTNRFGLTTRINSELFFQDAQDYPVKLRGLLGMDTELIRTVNKLQDTFATVSGDLELPQLVVVLWCSSSSISLNFDLLKRKTLLYAYLIRSEASLQESRASWKRKWTVIATLSKSKNAVS